MTGGNVINRPKTALQKNLNKLGRIRKAQKKKQLKGGGSKDGTNPKDNATVTLSAKKKRLILKQLKRQQKEQNKMEVVLQTPCKKEGKVGDGDNTEKMDTS